MSSANATPTQTPLQIEGSHRQIVLWLLICALTIFGMIVLGGVTRLTGSGLSIVEWQPLMGVLPPLSDEAWQATFEKYKQYPEYQKINYGMDVEGFKQIFFFEYAHRLLGRFIGILYFFPFVYFLWRKRIAKSLQPQLWILFVLGGLQGLMGWYMVKSGLVDVPRVSQYRLTAHLGLAVIIYGMMIWIAFGLLFPAQNKAVGQADSVIAVSPRLVRFAQILSGLIFVMILSGGLVAGLDAGFVYNTFPLMDGRFFPVGLYNLNPWWLNIFNDMTTVQFNHRLFAYLITALVGVFVFLMLRSTIDERTKRGVIALGVLLIVQVALGITTLLLIVPISLAAAHQAGAIALFSAALFVTQALSRQRS